jgi:hypothetical protein
MKLLYLKLSKVISSMWLSQVKVTLDYTFLPWNFKYGNTIFYKHGRRLYDSQVKEVLSLKFIS